MFTEEQQKELARCAKKLAGLKSPVLVRTMTNTELKSEWRTLRIWSDRKRDIEQELVYRGIRV